MRIERGDRAAARRPRARALADELNELARARLPFRRRAYLGCRALIADDAAILLRLLRALPAANVCMVGTERELVDPAADRMIARATVAVHTVARLPQAADRVLHTSAILRVRGAEHVLTERAAVRLIRRTQADAQVRSVDACLHCVTACISRRQCVHARGFAIAAHEKRDQRDARCTGHSDG